MHRAFRVLALAALALTMAMPFGISTASAHGHTEVGDYEIVIGFHNEPAYQGEPNGLDLFVTNKTTKQPVNGLEETLKAELLYGTSTVELPIRAQWDEEGAYTADVIPTEAGAYTWRIFGTIENTSVDVKMTGGPDTFSEIMSKAAVSFPAAEPTAADLRGEIGQARTFGIVGSVLGLLGVATAAFALLRRRAAPEATVTRQRA